MRSPGLLRGVWLSLATSLLLLAAFAVAQSTPPAKSHGVTRAELATLDLSKEIDGIGERMLAQHRTTIDPGGAIALHGHVDQPQIIFVFAGRLIDHQGEIAKEYVAGQSYAVGKSTQHWLENRGPEQAVFIATTVVKSH